METRTTPSIEPFVVIKDSKGEITHVVRVSNGKPVWYTVSITACSEFEEIANKWNELIIK